LAHDACELPRRPRAQGHIEDIKAKYGDASNAYRVRVLGEFPTSDDETVIPLELVLGAVGRNVSTLDYHPVWGVDVARFGDDRTALAKRQANKLLEPVKCWNSTDLMATAGKIKAEYDATPYDARPTPRLKPLPSSIPPIEVTTPTGPLDPLGKLLPPALRNFKVLTSSHTMSFMRWLSHSESVRESDGRAGLT